MKHSRSLLPAKENPQSMNRHRPRWTRCSEEQTDADFVSLLVGAEAARMAGIMVQAGGGHRSLDNSSGRVSP